MTSPKEIAERILEPSEERNSLIWEQIKNLARAYLELEDQLERVNGVIPQRDRFAHKIDDLQSEIVKLQQKLDDVENELFTLNEVYRMNRDYIDFVKGRLANTGFVTEQDIVDYRNEIKKDAGDAK